MKRLFADLLLAVSVVAMLSCEKGTVIPPPGDKPAESVEAYKSVANITDFADKIEGYDYF